MIRARVQMAVSALFGALTLLSMIWPAWIEGLTGLEPDDASGETEWWLAAAFAVLALMTTLLARREFRAVRIRLAQRVRAPDS